MDELLKDVLGAMGADLAAKNASTANLTYDQICKTLKFYCGWNPKTEQGIKSQIIEGLPSLTNVSVQIIDRGMNCIVRFTMPDGTRKTFRYC
jgi:hypothetical protein